MIVHVNVTEQIIDYMREKIASGEWKVGEKIPSEKQLTETLGVSRASVRDAIKYYIGQGVLESFHGKGTFLLESRPNQQPNIESTITSEDCENVQNVLEFRRIIESETCYMATEHITDKILQELETCMQTMYDNSDNKMVFLQADYNFHKIIGRACGNRLLEKSLFRVFEESNAANEKMYDLFGYRNGTYAHQKILDAMKKRDAKAARKAMYEHLQQSIEKLKTKEVIS